MRFGRVWWAHLKDHQFHGRLSLVGSANDGVDWLYCCLSSMGVNRLQPTQSSNPAPLREGSRF